MKFCRNCGREVREEAVVCIHCGCSIPQPAQFKKEEENTDMMAILAFVFSIVFPVVGLILSIIARKKLKDSADKTSKNFALAGLIISIVSLALTALAVMFYVFVFVIAILI